MKSVLIIGASRGLGLEFVRQYRADGWLTLGTCRSPEQDALLSSVGATALRLDVRDESVPIGDRTPAGKRVQVHAGEPKRRRNQGRGGFAVWPECLPVQRKRGIDFSRAPGEQHRPNRGFIHLQQFREWSDGRGGSDDGPNIEIPIRPSI